MIYGQSNGGLTASEFIKTSPHTFYLTGSRFFGGATTASDWDYFIADSLTVRRDLEAAGFKREAISYADDPNHTLVYQRENVHVQLVKDEPLKRGIQELLRPLMVEIMNRKWDSVRQRKRFHKALWNLAYSAHKAGVAVGSTPKVESNQASKQVLLPDSTWINKRLYSADDPVDLLGTINHVASNGNGSFMVTVMPPNSHVQRYYNIKNASEYGGVVSGNVALVY